MTPARGLSLIEVVAALVLLAGCAVTLLTAQGRSLDQLRAVRTQETAADLARELITSWKLDPTADLPLEGYFESTPGWRWERQECWYATGSQGNLQEVALTIYRPQSKGMGEEEALASYSWIERETDEKTTKEDR